MKATLARLGVRNFKPTLRKAAERLATVHTPEGMPLPPNVLAELQHDMARLGFVVSQIREIEDTRQKRLEQEPETGHHAMVRQVARVIGIGIETADMLVNEVLSRPMRGGLKHSSRFGIGSDAIGEEHCTKLAENDVKRAIVEWQVKRICLPPSDPLVSRLRGREIKHRLIQVCGGDVDATRQCTRQRASKSQCFFPAKPTTTSSRCHLSPRRGARRRIRLANSRPNLRPHCRIVSCVTEIPRAASISSTMRRLNGNRKYSHTA